jgi:hypothetical protein
VSKVYYESKATCINVPATRKTVEKNARLLATHVKYAEELLYLVYQN